MSFRSNLDFLYDHLPAFMRRDDAALPAPLFLRRFLSFFGQQMDGFDKVVDELHLKVAPATADEEWLNWLLSALFGWGWFPVWMTLAQKRQFYADIATHYARRGTARGIREFLAAFGIKSRVINQPIFYGEWTLGEDAWALATPLVVVIQIYPQRAALPEDLSFYGEWTLGEGAISDPALVPTRTDVDALLRFMQPLSHHFIIEDKTAA